MEFLDSFPEVVFEVDKNFTLTFLNASSEKITGYKKEELIGKKIELEKYFAPEEMAKMQKNFSENFKGNHITGNHYKMRTKYGEKIILKIIAVLNIFKIKKYKRNYRYFGQIFTIIKNESPHLNKIPCLY
ncbi:MAG: PAS domain-containing protein, partial [Bacteroidota bacterium]|nr:PAS domain-containing protein [Bacteroidota bacterium]